MAFGSGLDGFIGIAFETGAYGTYAAPVQFLEADSESIEPNVQSLKSFPIAHGRFSRTGRHRERIVGAAGPVPITVLNVGMLKVLKACFGIGVSAQVGSTPEYTHTFTPDNVNGLRGLNASMQIGRPSTSGTTYPFSHVGGKVVQWELAAGQNEFLKLTPTFDFKTVSTAQTLATPVYPAAATPYASFDAAIEVAGIARTTLKSISVRGDNKLATDRFGVGGVKLEPLADGESVISGEFAGEFDDLTAFDQWTEGAELEDLVITFTSPELIPTTSVNYKFVVTIPAFRYTGTAPKISGPGIVDQSLPFEAMYNGTDPIISVAVTSDETAI